MLKFVEDLLQGAPIEWKRLGEVAIIFSGRNKVRSENGKYPVYGSTGLVGCTDCCDYTTEQLLVARVGANAGYVHIASGEYAVSDNTLIVQNSNCLLRKFLYFFLVYSELNKLRKGGGQPLITGTQLKELFVPLPPLHVQEKIVEVLDKYTALENELEAKLKIELALRKKQYTYYRNKLLTFGEEVEWKTLGEVLVSIRTGLNPRQFFKLNTEDAVNDYITIRELYKGFIMPTERTDKINNEALRLCQQRSNLEIGDILFSATGTIGEMAVVKSPPTNWNIKEGVYALKPNSLLVLPSYIRYILSTDELKKQIRDKTEGSMVQSISMKGLRQITIPVPSLSEQARIVGILDKFDTLVNSLCEGLPREIELRHKQYEYYRDQLLSFPAKTK